MTTPTSEPGTSVVITNPNEPIVWDQYYGIKIMDIPVDMFPKVKELIIADVRRSTILFGDRSVETMENFYKDYENLIKFLLNDGCSLMAYDKKNHEVIGVVLLKVMRTEAKAWNSIEFFAQTYELKSILLLYKNMVDKIIENSKKDINILSNTLHIFKVCVRMSHAGFHWKVKLIESAYKLAASMFISKLSLVCFSISNQVRAQRAGMKETYRIYYANYLDKRNQRPFKIKIRREWYAIFYLRDVVCQIPYNQFEISNK